MKRQKVSALKLFALGSLIAAFTINGSIDATAAEKIGASAPPVKISPLAKQLNEAFVSVSNAVLPTVVSISVKIEPKNSSRNNGGQDFGGFGDFFDFFGGSPFSSPREQQPMEASGSGVIFSPNGYIVTNNHVVDDATDIKVTTYAKKTYKAKLIGTDPSTDLAVIKIEEEGLPTAFLANIDDVKIGEMVLAVGNPLGLNSTVTQGIVSAIGRGQLSLSAGRNGKQTIENFIQTDAAINPGNSGGGLFDLNGSLVGINSAIATRTGSFVGYGFAIPIDLVKNVAEDLIDDGKIDRGMIGVQFEPVNEAMAKAQGLDKVYGVIVQGVNKKSPAEKADIQSGDIILQIDGKDIKSSNELQGMVFSKKAGDKITLTVLRDGKQSKKTITLESLENNEFASNDGAVKGGKIEQDIDADAFEASFKNIGITVEKLSSDKKTENDSDYGVLISKVDRNGEAAQNGIAPGSILQKVDRQKINTPHDLNEIMKNKKQGDAVLLQIKYKNTTRMVALIIPKD
jgi:serine protease Do